MLHHAVSLFVLVSMTGCCAAALPAEEVDVDRHWSKLTATIKALEPAGAVPVVTEIRPRVSLEPVLITIVGPVPAPVLAKKVGVAP
jgi:hypothetical protein